jgi:hypothetical protein
VCCGLDWKALVNAVMNRQGSIKCWETTEWLHNIWPLRFSCCMYVCTYIHTYIHIYIQTYIHISKMSIFMLSIHLRLGLPSGLFPSGCPTNNLYMFLLSPIRATCPAHLILYNSNYTWRRVQIMKCVRTLTADTSPDGSVCADTNSRHLS